MRYYFDTNALYSIGKIKLDKNIFYYTSVLALYELVSGIDKDKFVKRRNILKKVIDSSIQIDWKMPENIIFDSFKVTKDCEFIEERVEPLKALIDRIIKCETFDSLIESFEYKDQKYNFEYFRKLDNNWSKGFISDTIAGNIRIKEKMKLGQNKFKLGNQEYEINKSKDLEPFFNNEKILNRAFTILALALMLKSKGIDDLTEEQIYNSYNGLIDLYIDAFTYFCSNKMTNSDSPATNDFVDLTHLLYLRNDSDNMIVSDDGLFLKFALKSTVKINNLIQNS